MKRLLFALSLLILFVGCKKEDKTRHFVITASKGDSVNAILKIDDANYPFTDNTLQKDVLVGEYDVVSVALSSSTSTQLSLDLSEDGNSMGGAYGNQYVYMIIGYAGISSTNNQTSTGGAGGAGGSGGSGGTGSGCSTVQCSGTTQAGARCKRMTTNCSGRCYQH